MKKSRSVINVLVLCILIATFLGDILLHILQKEKIVSKNRPCSRGLTAFIPIATLNCFINSLFNSLVTYQNFRFLCFYLQMSSINNDSDSTENTEYKS